jgi:tetratricopeptide (TPR) repeat protein
MELAQASEENKETAYIGAVVAFERMFELMPNDVSVQTTILQNLSLMDSPSAGRSLASRIITLREAAPSQEPENQQAYLYLAAMYGILSEYDDALTVYQRLIARWPDHIGSYIAVGDLYAKQGKQTAAYDAYEQALALDSASIPAYSRLIDLLEQQGQIDLAIAFARRASEYNPGRAWANLTLGKLYLLQAKAIGQ